MNTVDRTEMIDAYLSGTVSEIEKNEFERLLLDSDSSLEDRTNLRNEMELQKEIILAIRRRAFSEMLQREEAKIKEDEEHRRRVKRIVRWTISIGGASSAIAAMLLVLLIIAPMAQVMKDYSNRYVADVEVYASRGDDEVTQDFNEILLLMQNNQWDEAERIIDGIYYSDRAEEFNYYYKNEKEYYLKRKELDSLNNIYYRKYYGKQLAIDMERMELQEAIRLKEEELERYNKYRRYDKELLENRYYEAEWLKTMCLMHRGKTISARHLLRKIANSHSNYQSRAAELLKSL